MACRVRTPEFRNDIREREPVRNVKAFLQATAQLRARDVQNLVIIRRFVNRHVLCPILRVHHHAEGHHRNVQFIRMFLEEVLGIVRPVEVLTVRVFARPGMIAPDDNVRTAVVLANDRVPQGFAGTAHAHRQR